MTSPASPDPADKLGAKHWRAVVGIVALGLSFGFVLVRQLVEPDCCNATSWIQFANVWGFPGMIWIMGWLLIADQQTVAEILDRLPFVGNKGA